MHFVWVVLLYWLESALTEGCNIFVGNTKYDLSPLESTESFLYLNKFTGAAYEATVCNTAPSMMPKGCHTIDDAVAIQSGTCNYYGRYNSVHLTSFIDPNQPNLGVMIEYGNGGSLLIGV